MTVAVANDFGLEIFGDVYKDAFGIRPSDSTYAAFEAMDVAQRAVELASLQRVIDVDEELRRAYVERALADFVVEMNKLVETGARDYETAIRWMMQADEMEYETVEGYLSWTGLDKAAIARINEMIGEQNE